ncbi:DUF2752 domain-containing protein [Saccharopolyspora rosea]|uniref:DUF2752 domain-containing protein n=1 Tax=Saccharopolyspora rosea TaxID=524884 RepID=UPI0021DA878D|nr:DUF2752 domain-containing protein [Saccharopolyspora rosea]
MSSAVRGVLTFPFRRLPQTTSMVVTTGAVGLVLGTGIVPVPCPFRLITGLDCPFCGGSRMIGALLRGDVVQAWHLNAFALVLLVPLAAVVVGAAAAHELGCVDRRWPSGRAGRALTFALVGSLVVWTVLRNLPFGPFPALRA